MQRLVFVRPDGAVGGAFRCGRRGGAGQGPARVGFDCLAILRRGLAQVGALRGRQLLDDRRSGIAGVEMRLEERFVEGEDQLEFDAEGEGEGGVGHGCSCD